MKNIIQSVEFWPVLMAFILAPLLNACNSNAESKIQSNISVEAEQVVSGIDIGWGMAFLPNGDLLITEKSGVLHVVRDGELHNEIGGIPGDLDVNGQGGFLDIKLHPDYANNEWVYFTYASNSGPGDGSNTALIRAKIQDNQLVEKETLYKAEPNSTRSQHYGSRIEFDNEGFVYFSIGDRGNQDVNPQDLGMDGGKIYRLNDDGSIPSNNPFVGEDGAKEAVYSYGHRNPQGMDIHPETGQIWIHEHGPQGGDEINIVEAGKNYGWPEVGYGINYNGTPYAEDTTRADVEPPIKYWDPSIAPSGMAFINSEVYPGWQGDLLVGSLKFTYIAHLEMEGENVISEEKLAEDIGRIRAIEQGPDGYIYFTAENAGVYRLIPEEE
ncbi:MAG: PQQ-dependent sugar dehydrogenase [Balneolaceae bacterium]